MVLAGLAVVPLVRYVHPSKVVAGGLLLAGLGYATVMVVGEHASAPALMLAFVILAIGIGSAETLSNDLVVSTVPAPRAGCRVGDLGDRVRGRGGARHGRAGQHPHHVVPVVGAGADRAQLRRRCRRLETLGGATAVAAELPARQGELLMESARQAFDSGVVLTSGIGVAFMVVAAAVALGTLRNAS
jgi:DHA2 family multidrug resistance protein-like MFS transporter